MLVQSPADALAAAFFIHADIVDIEGPDVCQDRIADDLFMDAEGVSFDLSELIRSVLEAQKIRLNEAGAVLITELESPAPVLADEFKIEEAFTNYLNNAINHLDGQKRIRVRLEEAFEGTDHDARRMWKVSVYNDGEPIPEESLDKLWDKFYKVDKSRSRQYGGSGIGLSIVKAVVEAHKGSCGVKNTEEGVEFMFMLPAEKILDEEKVK